MKLKDYLKNFYSKLVGTDDTPHRIALGFAIGIFYGLFPFVGVIFTIVTVIILRANKAIAIIGCFLTNTWMTVFLALPSVKLGSKIFGLDWHVVWQDIRRYMGMSDIRDIFKALSGDVIIPLVIGFLIIDFCIAAVAYISALYLVVKYRSRKK
jgi:uncharacterized protein (DUF2062 family)